MSGIKRRISEIYSIALGVIIITVDILSFSSGDDFLWYDLAKNEHASVYEITTSVEKGFKENIWNRYGWVNLSGFFSKICGIRSMYKSENVYVGDNGYILGSYKETSTDYEFKQILSFSEWLEERDIVFLYVNEPIKYLDDSETFKQFGLVSYGNQNADVLVHRLEKASVNTLDLRDNILEDGLDSWEMFYRTDHHWTVPAGLWATRNISEKINQLGDLHIDGDVYKNDQYTYTYYSHAWLGEQGRRVGSAYVGLDDYTLIEPLFDTDLELYRSGHRVASGNFDILLDKSRLDITADPYSVKGWHYTYMPSRIGRTSIINKNVKDGKILYLGDSYDQVVIPFLALGVHQVDSYVLRKMKLSVRDIVEDGDYDIVIMAYAQFIIGAHDDPNNVNYRMYDLE